MIKTGWPPGLMQDDSSELSRWFASRLDARQVVRRFHGVTAQSLRLVAARFKEGGLAMKSILIPRTADDIRQFIGSNFNSAELSGNEPGPDDRYSLTAHDLLQAFREWEEVGAAGWNPSAQPVSNPEHGGTP